LEKLNALVHPAVALDTEKWMMLHEKEPYIIKEAAILFESGAYKSCDYIISVIADVETRIQRVMERDGIGENAVLARMDNQMDSNFILSLSDFVIDNNGDRSIISQIIKLHKRFLVLADIS
jgi:dephospho-CoA kinase